MTSAPTMHTHTVECRRRQIAVEAVIRSAAQMDQDDYRRALAQALAYRCGVSNDVRP